jgi:NTE family protein
MTSNGTTKANGKKAVQTLRETLREEPFALTMSAGFFAFYAHTGFMTTLEEEGLLPIRVSGASAGALVSASWAAGLNAPELARELERLQRADFWDPGFGPGLLKGQLFRDRMTSLLPAQTFDACRVPVAVSVFDVAKRTTSVIDSGDVPSAICASCCVPFLFHPVRIAGRTYLDGGILDRPGLLGMPKTESRLFFHHIASKSAWRLKNEVPRREGMFALVIEGLPRSGPFRLEEGRRAYHAARKATKRALDQKVEDGLVVISCE